MGFNITYSSKPVYDSWGFGDYWSCVDWVKWFNAMKDHYGKKLATEKWIDAWLDGLSISSGGRAKVAGTSWWNDAVNLDCRSFNPTFIKFLNENPDINDVVRQGIGGTITAPIGTAVGLTSNITSGISNIGQGIETTTKVLKYVIPVILIVGAGFFMYIGYKKLSK